MPEAEWPLTVRLTPGASRLDSFIVPAPKYNNSSTIQDSQRKIPQLSRDFTEQQDQLIADAFSILCGGEGDFLKFSETFDPAVLDDKLGGPQYKLPRSLDPSLRDVLTQITDAAGSAYAIRTFADHYGSIEYGKVNQALSSAFRVLYNLYLSLIARIESQWIQNEKRGTTLYGIWIHLEPFVPHLSNSRVLITRFMEETRLARERKRLHGAMDLVERASTTQFVAHDDKEAVIELRGGAVLRSIADLMRRTMGDLEASNLYEELIAAASKPYLGMLEIWITKGELNDPFEEFLVQQTKAYKLVSSEENLDDYWDKRYAVRAMDLPLQLSSPRIYNMLLISGKYLNVIREGEGSFMHDTSANISEIGLDKCRSVEDPRVVEAVTQAYNYANKALLDMFAKPPVFNLKALFETLRKVFFLHNSNLYDTFLSNAYCELQKPAISISKAKLEQAMTLAKDPEDPWAQYINVNLATEPVKEALLSVVASEEESGGEVVNSKNDNTDKLHEEKLIGIDALQFDFKVPFPLSLVVSRRSIMRYQFLFRHIVELKTAQDILSGSWVSQVLDLRWKIPAKAYASDAAHWIRRAGILRSRKLQLVTGLLYHSTVDGMQHEYEMFLESLESMKEVSELTDAHIRFLDRSLMNCLLSDPQLLKVKARLLSLCRQFVKFLDSNSDAVAYFSSSSDVPMMDDNGNEIQANEVLSWFAQTVERYEQAFNRNIKRFYAQLEEYMPTNYIAGSATIYLIQRLEPLLPKV